MQRNLQFLAQISLITLLILGCLSVLSPFLAAILFAAVICVTTWPLYARLYRLCGKRDTLAAAGMTLILIFGLLLPTLFLAMGLHSAVLMVVEIIRAWFKPGNGGIGYVFAEWLRELPYVGEHAFAYWQKISGNREEMQKILQSVLGPFQRFALNVITVVGNGVLQLVLVIFISFFLYRDGAALARMLKDAAERLGGALGVELLTLSNSTVTGVMIGIIGTAMAQALVALIGFMIAGVPGVILLSIAVFFLSMIPVGPPLVWGGAAFWLYSQGQTGWAIFMVIYGIFGISSVDNLVKPILISRSSSLPILLTVLGVFGGILAFGFIGIFLGPTLLALGTVLLKRWLAANSEITSAVTESG
ncbi:MAG: AI-2E family transporter [Zoogloeaceae bacterium]|jgi:predicted PurR-regulated permease PerM|nr:AI-2E family transporter [Zoogloeaceae bacterium]